MTSPSARTWPSSVGDREPARWLSRSSVVGPSRLVSGWVDEWDDPSTCVEDQSVITSTRLAAFHVFGKNLIAAENSSLGENPSNIRFPYLSGKSRLRVVGVTRGFSTYEFARVFDPISHHWPLSSLTEEASAPVVTLVTDIAAGTRVGRISNFRLLIRLRP